MTPSNTAAPTGPHEAAANATNRQPFVPISKKEFTSIVWKLKSIGSTASDLHQKLQSLRFGTAFIVLNENEVSAFCDVLHDVVFVNLSEIIEQLDQSDGLGLRTTGLRLRWYLDHIEFILNYLFPNEKPEHRPICKSDIESIFFLFDEIRSGLYRSTAELENSIADSTQEDTYEILITKRIKAIEPKFEALSKKYHHHEGSELLANPEAVLKATESLRNEIQELQNKTPKDSEEWTDCRISIEELDFLIRLIKTKFEFRKSDVYALSLIVDQAGDNIERISEWLAPDDGGDLVDTVH